MEIPKIMSVFQNGTSGSLARGRGPAYAIASAIASIQELVSRR